MKSQFAKESSDRALCLLSSNVWHFAKTLAHIPHWYTRGREWDSRSDFEWVVQYIRDNSIKETFHATGSYVYEYLYADKFKYWTFNEPVHECILINRAEVVLGKLSKDAQKMAGYGV